MSQRGRRRRSQPEEPRTRAPERGPGEQPADNLAGEPNSDEEGASSEEAVDEAQVDDEEVESLSSEISAHLDDHLDENFLAMQEGFVIDGAEEEKAVNASGEEVDVDGNNIAPPLDEVLAPDTSELDPAGAAEADVRLEEEGPDAVNEEDADAEEAALPPEPVIVQPMRQRAEVKLEVDGGLITYYATKNIFVATCRNESHGKCSLTRSALPGRRRGQGRPLGLLKAWLCIGQD